MKLFRKIINKLDWEVQHGYSQFGEDLILAHLFQQNGLSRPSYLDIGANEPRYISNTFYFYLRGSRGVLVEPNPHLAKKLKRVRPLDKVVNAGIGHTEAAEADFYLFPAYASGLSTFSATEAQHWTEIGMKGRGKIPVEKIIKMPLLTINSIIEQHFNSAAPDLLSLDVEGLDLAILQSLDFSKYSPKAICVETLAYDQDQQGYKLHDIADYMAAKNYAVYADTRVNTIFCRKDIFKQ